MNQRDSMDAPMPVAVVGVGRMGRHHVRTYAKLPQAELVGVVDRDAQRREAVAQDFGVKAYADVEALLAAHPDLKAVTVAVPTRAHLHEASALINHGVACLVEKPIAPDPQQARELVDLASQKAVVLQIGHTERFNPVVRSVLHMDLSPRFIEVQRVSPMTFRSLDVGVVMDMMIHDLDIVLTLARSPVKRVDAAGVCVLAEHEDIANARVAFENGCVANITASRLAMKTERRTRIFSEQAYVTLDYQKQFGLVITKQDNAQTLEQVRKQLQQGADLSQLDYTDLVRIKEMPMEGGESDPLTAELTSFLQCVAQGSTPVVDGPAGLAAVELAQQVIESIRTHHWEGLNGPRV